MSDRHYSNGCRFALISFELDPGSLTDHFRSQPDRTWRKGDRRGQSSLLHEHNGWLLLQDDPSAFSVEEQLEVLIQRVRPLVAQGIPAGWEIEISVEILSGGGFPPMTLPPEMLRYLGEIGASIDVDIPG